ncbi:MAG: ClbS/DfsB family four-helix bundle protein [Candidatus Promineifilaceae bacterium]|nr:ClbS/DfsB family four-helix bundle protein [Candidatus Promineifilaceae bacterium]
MSTTEQLLDQLDNSRAMLLTAIEPLPDEALLDKRAIGDWSVADVLINLTAWEAELVTGLMRIKKGQRPDRLLAALRDPQTYDEQRYEETQGRDLDQIFLDLQQVRIQVEEWLLEFSERELKDPRRYKWLKGKPLSEIIAITTFKRELGFVPRISQYSHNWMEQETAANSDLIPLTTLNLKTDTNHDSTN